MYEFIAKSLYFLLNPVNWIFGLLLFALIKKRWRHNLLVAAFATLFVFGNPFIFRLVIKWWEAPTLAYERIPATHTAFVLGGALKLEDHTGQFNFNDAADRYLIPFSLLQEGRIKTLVVSAARLSKPNAPNHLMLYKQRLGNLGADTSRIFVESQALNTYENATLGKAFLQKKGLLNKGPILLVTSAKHMPRAAACFNKQGVNFIPLAVDSQTSYGYPNKWEDYILPSSRTLQNWNSLTKEMVGLLAYKMLGYA